MLTVIDYLEKYSKGALEAAEGWVKRIEELQDELREAKEKRDECLKVAEDFDRAALLLGDQK